MQISERRVGDVTILDASGRMTRNEGYGMAKQRITELIEEGRRDLLLNLAEVPYMDSTCVGELVSAFITTRSKGGKLKLVRATGRIKELLNVARLDTVFEVFDTEDAAIESYSRS